MRPSSAAIRQTFLDIQEGASEISMRYFDRLEAGDVEEKGSLRDLLTIADSACEAHAIATIQRHFPEHAILGEEGGYLPGEDPNSPCLWVIDPIDGTTNFTRSFPFFATSVGLLFAGVPHAGIVVAPRLGEVFEAIVGEGATLNGKPIGVSKTTEIERSILATGFSYNRNEVERNNVDNFGKLILEAHDIRRLGAASLDLCYVACGRLDGYWEAYLKPWDLAAGAAIVAEAGGVLTSFSGDASPHSWIWEENLVAANPQLQPLLRSALSGVEKGYTPAYIEMRDRVVVRDEH